jgi:hypothetical protein
MSAPAWRPMSRRRAASVMPCGDALDRLHALVGYERVHSWMAHGVPFAVALLMGALELPEHLHADAVRILLSYTSNPGLTLAEPTQALRVLAVGVALGHGIDLVSSFTDEDESPS